MELLLIERPHAISVATLPLHDRDPFDWILIVESLTESIPILSADSIFDTYGVTRLW
jgi:PIN domain nuclease of toxin-antitoxin system